MTDSLVEAYRASHPRSAALHEQADRLFAADGATHFNRVRQPFRPYIDRAIGALKWDVDGNEYVDYVMGHGSLVLGNAHPAVVEAVQRQAARGFHYGENHELELQWGGWIRKLMPAAERIEYCASGQEANQMAIRIARVVTGKRRILKFDHNYHGWADELTGKGSPGALEDHVSVIPANDLDLVDRTLQAAEFAAVLIEGGGGRVSGRAPTDLEFFQALPDLCRQRGVVLLLDEVVTGFREAPGGWQEVAGIKPDLTTIGKAASGGLPSGAVLGRAELFAPFSSSTPPERRIVHGGTWNALPLTCAAGVAACAIYADGAPQRTARAMADKLRRDGNAMFARMGFNARFYGRSIVHLYLGQLDHEPDDDTVAPAAVGKLMARESAPLYQRLDLHLLQRGIATMRGEVFCLSAAHTEAHVDRTVAALEDSLTAMRHEGTI